MTKEQLDRIKKAYSSGLKVQIWLNGYWKDFDIRDYSMYSEPFSKNRQYRIVGSDYADIAENRIEHLEKENEELRNNGFTVSAMTEQQLRVAIEKGEQLERENAELSMKRKAERKIFQGIVEKKNDQLAQAREIIKQLLSCCRNYPQENAEKIERAEQFLNSKVEK